MRITLDASTIYRQPQRGVDKNLIALFAVWWRCDRIGVSSPITEQPVIFHCCCRWRPSTPCTSRRSAVTLTPAVDGGLPLAAWRNGADVAHCPTNYCRSWAPLSTFVTIYAPDLHRLNLVGANTRYVCGHLPHRSILLRENLQQVVWDAQVIMVPMANFGFDRQCLMDKAVVALTGSGVLVFIPETCRHRLKPLRRLPRSAHMKPMDQAA